MSTKKVALISLIVCSLLVSYTITALAKDTVGSVVAIRGKAFIERDQKEREARIKDGLLFEESVSTREVSRAKLLFIDDSVITLAENSRLVVREFLAGKDKKGKSIFNLIDGKLKAVVGKNEFEVHTPSAVAAARGTVFYVSVFKKKDTICTTILTEKDVVNAISTDPENRGNAFVNEDMIITICRGEPFPSPHRASPEEKKNLLDATNLNTYEISLPSPLDSGKGLPVFDVPSAPNIDQQPVVHKDSGAITPPPTPIPTPTPDPTPPPTPPPPPPQDYYWSKPVNPPHNQQPPTIDGGK